MKLSFHQNGVIQEQVVELAPSSPTPVLSATGSEIDMGTSLGGGPEVIRLDVVDNGRLARVWVRLSLTKRGAVRVTLIKHDQKDNHKDRQVSMDAGWRVL